MRTMTGSTNSLHEEVVIVDTFLTPVGISGSLSLVTDISGVNITGSTRTLSVTGSATQSGQWTINVTGSAFNKLVPTAPISYGPVTLTDDYPNSVRIVSDTGSNPITFIAYNYAFDGSTWDRIRDPRTYTQNVTGSVNIIGGTIGISGSSATLAFTGSISNASFGFSGSVSLTTSGSSTVLSANSGSKIIDSGSGLRIKIYDIGMACIATGNHYFYFGTTTGSTQAKRLLSFGNSGSAHSTFVQPRTSATADALFLISSVADTVNYDFGFVQE